VGLLYIACRWYADRRKSISPVVARLI
jgi:hypothetical protein